ncbi:MAG: hypothetical protein QME52_07465 [Bacteroidota bacterium]|nr:hypothetical protein [Bacteroidota bacterium]
MWKICLIFLLFTKQAAGGFERTEMGARPAGCGNAYVGIADDVSAIFYNVGGLANLKYKQLSIFYSPQPYGLSELSFGGVACGLPTSYGVFGISFRRYGFELYRELSGSLAYSNIITGIHLGINLNYHTVTISNYGSAGTIGIDIGILLPLMDVMRLGISLKNVNSPTIGRSSEKLPQSFTTGIAYLPFENLCLMLDVYKETSFEPSPRFGFEYWIVDAVGLRGGFCNEPASYSSGIGIRYSFFQIDYGVSIQPVLGWTHSFSVTIQ